MKDSTDNIRKLQYLSIIITVLQSNHVWKKNCSSFAVTTTSEIFDSATGKFSLSHPLPFFAAAGQAVELEPGKIGIICMHKGTGAIMNPDVTTTQRIIVLWKIWQFQELSSNYFYCTFFSELALFTYSSQLTRLFKSFWFQNLAITNSIYVYTVYIKFYIGKICYQHLTSCSTKSTIYLGYVIMWTLDSYWDF